MAEEQCGILDAVRCPDPIRRYIFMLVKAMRSTLSADTREQRKRRQKADLRTFKRIVLTYHPYRSQMFRVLVAIFYNNCSKSSYASYASSNF